MRHIAVSRTDVDAVTCVRLGLWLWLVRVRVRGSGSGIGVRIVFEKLQTLSPWIRNMNPQSRIRQRERTRERARYDRISGVRVRFGETIQRNWTMRERWS